MGQLVSIEEGRRGASHRLATGVRDSLVRVSDDDSGQEESVVYIYDGLKRWWSDRRVKEWLIAMFVIGLLLGLVIGLIVGHVLAIYHASEIVTTSSAFYHSLVARGDAAMHAAISAARGEETKIVSGAGGIAAALKQGKKIIE